MLAILRTWKDEGQFDCKPVVIHDGHDFFKGPYQDTVPFTVGSNQEILPYEEYRHLLLTE